LYTATTASAPVSSRPAATAKPIAKPKRKRGRRKRAGGRAQQALRLIRAEPGVTVSELAEKMDIKGTYLYKILPPLEQKGEIEKRDRGWYPKAA
jgi:ribosomal protein S25